MEQICKNFSHSGNTSSGSKSKSAAKNKLYRNLAPVFTIDDDQDSDGNIYFFNFYKRN